MKIVLFYQSLLSDWNHGNAHFLRGIASELLLRGDAVHVYEPRDSWSLQNLIDHWGTVPIRQFRQAYPGLGSVRYDWETLDLDEVLDGADLVIVHEWNKPEFAKKIGSHHRTGRRYKLLFHDTHHRSVTDPAAMEAYGLSNYDGVLAFGDVIREIYIQRGWAAKAWTWHEAADTRVFYPREADHKDGDLIWIGNWGDEERSAELYEYLLAPVKELGLRARIYGVRYPPSALRALERAGIEYGNWLPNYNGPEAFSRFRVTLHIPRRPYVEALPGVPTIRPFEALSCGIPLISSPWSDRDNLFTPGKDFLVARDGREMREHLRSILLDPGLARELSSHGRRTILRRHTCAHRVDELMAICRELGLPSGHRSAARGRS